MIRKTLSIIAAVTLITLGLNQRSEVPAQTLNGSQITPGVRLDITDMELFGSTSMLVRWIVDKRGSAVIKGYELTLELSRNGVTERFVQNPSPTSASTTLNLAGISADKRTRLFGPSLKATAVLKVSYVAYGRGQTFDTQETKTFNASPIEK